MREGTWTILLGKRFSVQCRQTGAILALFDTKEEAIGYVKHQIDMGEQFVYGIYDGNKGLVRLDDDMNEIQSPTEDK